MGRWRGGPPSWHLCSPQFAGGVGAVQALCACPMPTPCPWDPWFYTVVCRINVMLEGLVVRVLRGGCGHDAMVAGTAWAWTPEQ